MSAPAISAKPLLKAATVVGKGEPVYDIRSLKTFQAYITGAGAVSATVVFEGSNFGDEGTFVTLGTVTLTGTNIATDGFVHDAPWAYVRANLTALGAGTTAHAALGN